MDKQRTRSDIAFKPIRIGSYRLRPAADHPYAGNAISLGHGLVVPVPEFRTISAPGGVLVFCRESQSRDDQVTSTVGTWTSVHRHGNCQEKNYGVRAG